MSSKRWSIGFKSGGFNFSAVVDEDDGACDAEAIVARETRTSNQGVDAAVLVSLNGDGPAKPFKARHGLFLRDLVRMGLNL